MHEIGVHQDIVDGLSVLGTQAREAIEDCGHLHFVHLPLAFNILDVGALHIGDEFVYVEILLCGLHSFVNFFI